MGYTEATFDVHAPIEAVWNTLNDIDHTPEWVVGLEGAEIVSPGTFGKGTVYIDYNRLGPFPQKSFWRILEFEPMKRQVHEVEAGGMPSTMTLRLRPIPGGTRVTFEVEYRLMGWLGPVSRLLEMLVMNRLIKQVISQNLANLDRYLTRRVPQPA